jgi:hypothetical protein
MSLPAGLTGSGQFTRRPDSQGDPNIMAPHKTRNDETTEVPTTEADEEAHP